MIKFSSSFKLNEIHGLDSPFNEDSKNINFFQGFPNFGGGTAGKFSPLRVKNFTDTLRLSSNNVTNVSNFWARKE